jgi:WD40 repeat protein/serine/threonine protein kinase
MGGFILRGRIGEGSFGTVYCCEQPLLGREVVVKVLHRKLHRRDVIVQRFLREAQLASRLDHPYAAHIYAFGIEEHDRLLWIAMERVHGVTLAEWLSRHGPMPLGQLVAFFERIASVVHTAHERGIVHRDLKPSNVMVLERAGELLPKLLDFGVAKLRDGEVLPEVIPDIRYPPLPARDDAPGSSPANVVRKPGNSTLTNPSAPPQGDPVRLTRDDDTVGSPPYMSPEQWGNAVTVGPASDLYALAVVAFEALTGRRPFQGATLVEYAELHRRGDVPALGGSFLPALDRMFQRALAKRPEDRWGSALELAGALRAASGIGAARSDLPRIDHDVRDAWLAEAPQPLAESMAELDDAHNAYQARYIAEGLVRTLVRYLLVVALAMSARVHADEDDPVLLDLLRALGRRELGLDERVRLLRLLVHRLAGPCRAHPVPALLALLTPDPGNTDGLDPILALTTATDHAVTEEVVRLQLLRLIPELTKLLRKTTFVLDHVLVVPRNHAAERWTGRRCQPRVLMNVLDELVEDHPMLIDRAGRVCVDLWPLVQVAPPTEGAEAELFLFDGHGHHGALLIAAPAGIEQHDAVARDWVATHVIAEIKTKTRMRDQIRVAAYQWQDRARPDALLWRGEVLAELERWTRHTTGAAVLDDLEASFVAASRRVGRRTRWIRRSIVVLAAAAVVAGLVYWAAMQARVARDEATLAQQQARMAQQEVTQAEVEEGRQALLHGESKEAQLHLSEAYRRGDHSPATAFMLSRALQPRMAEQARFTATSGRMWSAAFSPDGTQIVTTDDRSAQVRDAQTGRLLFTLPHGSEVYHAVYSADSARLVTAAEDAVRIWDPASGALVHELKQKRSDGKPADYSIAVISPDGKLVAAIDAAGRAADVWDTGTGAPLAQLRNDASGFPSIAFSADGRWLATSGGNNVRVFDVGTWAQVRTLAGRRLSWDPTGPRLLTGSAEGDVSLWEIPSASRLQHLREIGEQVNGVAFSPNGELVVAASEDGAELVWDARSGKLRTQRNYLHGKILSVEFDRTSTLLVTAGASGSVAVADAALGMLVTMLDGPRNIVRVAHFDPSSRRVVGASWDGTARVWDATAPYRRWSSPPVNDECGLVSSLEPDRRFIAVSCMDHPTRIWDTAHAQLLAELPSVTLVGGDFASAFPAVSAAGDRAAIARGNTVEIYGVPGGRLLRTIAHGAAVNAVAFASTGGDLISGAVDGSLLVTRDDGALLTLPTASGGIDAAGFLPDGRVIAADASRRLRVYYPGGAVLADLELTARVRTLRMSLDSRRLVTVPSFMGKAAPPDLWDLEHYQPIAQLDDQAQVFSARFVAGGQIVTACGDGAARLWDGATGKLRQTYRGGSRFLVDVTLSPDGSMIVAGGGDGLLRFWDAASGRPLWTMPAHKSHLVGIRVEADDIITRGFSGDISRWTLPKSKQVIEACSDHERCAIVSR